MEKQHSTKIPDYNKETIKSRAFLGKKDRFSNSEEKGYYQKMLKAYLKGGFMFKYKGEDYQVHFRSDKGEEFVPANFPDFVELESESDNQKQK